MAEHTIGYETTLHLIHHACGRLYTGRLKKFVLVFSPNYTIYVSSERESGVIRQFPWVRSNITAQKWEG